MRGRPSDVQPCLPHSIFGFKTVKWPPTWYAAIALLDALAGHRSLWRDDASSVRHSVAQLLACLVADNVGLDGRVTPRSAYRLPDGLSSGPRGYPSAFATARVLATRFAYDDLVADGAIVDVTTATGSKGGSGMARPPATVPVVGRAGSR